MNTIFMFCALVGGTFVVLQFVLNLIGFGADSMGDADFGADAGDFGDVGDVGEVGDVGDVGDADLGDGGHSADGHHHGATGVVKVLTFQTIVAFLAFFGLGGLATQRAGRPDSVAFGVALVCGLAAMWAVAYVMYGFHRLGSDPTIRLRRAVGCSGQVYLRIPAESGGEGKVTITLQERTVEMNAKTPGPELPTGADIVVTRLIDQQTLEVVAADSDRG